jgi:hypothetical protein
MEVVALSTLVCLQWMPEVSIKKDNFFWCVLSSGVVILGMLPFV